MNSRYFSFIAEEETSFKVEGQNAIIPEAGVDLLVLVRIPEIIAKIDLSDIEDGDQITKDNPIETSNPCPLIKESADDLYTCFVEGIELAAELGKDRNGDGELEDDDDDSEEDESEDD